MTVVINGTTGYSGPVGVLGDLTTTGNTILGDQSTDTLNVANGNLVLNSSGNLGIGTSSPASKLDVVGANKTNANEYGVITAWSSDSYAADKGGSLAFWGKYNSSSGNACFGRIYGAKENGTDGSFLGYLGFSTSPGGTPVERMRLDSSGNLGIGTSSPSAKLDVASSSDITSAVRTTGSGSSASLLLTNGNGTTSAKYSYVRYFNNDSAAQEWRVGTYGSDNFIFRNNNTGSTFLTLDSSGNLGLGVTPSAWTSSKAFDVGSYGSLWNSGGGVGVNANSYYGSGWKYKNTAAASMYQQDSGAHYWYNAPSGTAGNAITFTQAMTLDASGNFGIGVTSMAQKLQVNGKAIIGSYASTGAYGLYLRSDAASVHYNWQISTQNAVDGGFEIARSSATGGATFNSPSLVIDSSGNLLVGRTSTINNFKLVVGGTDAQLGLDGVSTYAQINYSMNGVYKAQTYYAVSGDRFVTQCGSTGGVYLSNGATSWTALSDERTKDIIEPIVGGISKLANLRTVIGKYKTDAEGTRRSFLIAQDVLNSFPEAVDTSDPDEMGVRYQDLTPVLVAAIKELKSELDSVKAELAALKGN